MNGMGLLQAALDGGSEAAREARQEEDHDDDGDAELYSGDWQHPTAAH